MDATEATELDWRGALSAMLDGEEPALGVPEVAAHLAGCPDCSAWLDAATDVGRRVRTLPVIEAPLGERIVDAVDVRLCGCKTGQPCLCRNCQCGPGCTCHTAPVS